MSPSDQVKSPGPAEAGRDGNHVITPEQYSRPKSTAQKLTPLDMNMPRLYGARWILCFPLPPGVDNAKIYDDLATGLAHTIKTIPWLAGQIGPEEGSNPADNRIQIVDSSDGFSFPCKDLADTLPSYDELKKDSFPLSKLSTAQLGPIGVMPGSTQPVLAAQANFIQGGLLLTIGVHHSACDAAALDAIVATWSQNTAAASGSGTFTTPDAPSNDRRPLMKGTPGADIADFPEYRLAPSRGQQEHATPPSAYQLPPMAAHILRFSPESLARLKAEAAAFSTHDALSAFLWRHMTLARQVPGAPGAAGAPGSVLALAANMRGRASPPLPPTYLGNASMITVTERLPSSELVAEGGLARAAASVRRSVTAIGSPSRVPLTIGLLQSRPDPTEFQLAYSAFLGPDVVATSWADMKVYEGDWGVLGEVECFRVPGEGADGVVMILPRLRDGGLEVLVGLEAGAMGGFLEDGRVRDAARVGGQM